jgi:hypothetical protein
VNNVFAKSAGKKHQEKITKCLNGYKEAIKKHEINLVKDESEKICRTLFENKNSWDKRAYLTDIWKGANFHMLFEQASRKGFKDTLIASCKAGAFMALGPKEDSLKETGLSLSVAAHEICIGAIAEGETYQRTRLHENKKLSERYQVVRKNGEFIKHGPFKQFYKSGQESVSSHYTYGKLDGTRTYYEKDGKKREIASFKAGKRHGHYERHHKGALKEKGSYKKDKQDGKWEYFEKGRLAKSRVYKNGKVVSDTKFNP